MKPFHAFAQTLFLMLGLSAAVSAQSLNVQTVMNNYAAFGRGDIPVILGTLAPNCSWTHPGNPAIIPFAGTFRGPEEIAQKFFAAIPGAVQITSFEPMVKGENGNTVITTVNIAGKAIATGKAYANVAEMRWTFDGPGGKVIAYEVIVDTKDLEAALSK